MPVPSRTRFLSFLYSFLSVIPFQMAFVPRRSPRLAQKAAKAAVATAAPPIPGYTRETAREVFLRVRNNPQPIDAVVKNRFIADVKGFLDEIEATSDRTLKAISITALVEYMIRNPAMLAAYPKLGAVVLLKMYELEKEAIDHPAINRGFHESVSDLKYIIS